MNYKKCEKNSMSKKNIYILTKVVPYLLAAILIATSKNIII